MDEFAEVFKALSNPHRLKIFMRLVSCCTPGTVSCVDEESSAYVGQLGEELGVVRLQREGLSVTLLLAEADGLDALAVDVGQELLCGQAIVIIDSVVFETAAVAWCDRDTETRGKAAVRTLNRARNCVFGANRVF